MPLERTLIFIFNSDSGVLPKIKDYASRAAASGGDGCSLYLPHLQSHWHEEGVEAFHPRSGHPGPVPEPQRILLRVGPGALKFPVVLLQAGSESAASISTKRSNGVQVWGSHRSCTTEG